MPEWLNGAVSKTVVALVVTVGSNPTLSAHKIKSPRFDSGDSYLFIKQKLTRRYRIGYSHPLEDGFQRHGMHTAPAGHKVFTITFPRAIFIIYNMSVIVTFNRDFERMEIKPFAFLRVTFCLFDLADHTVIHLYQLLLVNMVAKRHALTGVPSDISSSMVNQYSHGDQFSDIGNILDPFTRFVNRDHPTITLRLELGHFFFHHDGILTALIVPAPGFNFVITVL